MPLTIGHEQSHKTRLSRFLDQTGDGTGNTSANINAAGAPIDFKIVPPPGLTFRIFRLLVHYSDTGSIDAGFYGNGIVLANGVTVSVKDMLGVKHLLTDLVPIKTNAQWGEHNFDAVPVTFGSGDNSMSIRWSFMKGGQPLLLNGSLGEFFAVTLNDNFTGLNEQHFKVEGWVE